MDAQKFGAFIAEMRKARGLTQAALAAQLHVTDKAVSRPSACPKAPSPTRKPARPSPTP